MIRRELKNLGLGLIGVAALLVFSGCGGDGGVQLANQVKLTVDDQTKTVELQILLNEGVEVNFDGEIPIEDYGSIIFAPAGYDSPAMIIIKGNYSEYSGSLPGTIGKASTLPNGGRFPAAVVPPLYYLSLSNEGSFTPIFYFAADKYVQVGVGLLIPALGDKFPAGLVLSQNFRDNQGHAVASVSIFGPMKDSNDVVQVPGGLYLHGNFGDLSSQTGPTDPIVIGGNSTGKKAAMMKKSSRRSSTFTQFTTVFEDPFHTGPKTYSQAVDLGNRVKKVFRDLH